VAGGGSGGDASNSSGAGGGSPRAGAADGGAPPPPQSRRIDLCVFEDEPQLLARHMLLLYALLDGAAPPHVRPALFLELHGSALLRRRTADWLGAAACMWAAGGMGPSPCRMRARARGQRLAPWHCPRPAPRPAPILAPPTTRPHRPAAEASRVLEEAVVLASAKPAAPTARCPDAAALHDAGAAAGGGGGAPPAGRSGDPARLAAFFDLGLLKFQQRDELLATFQRWRQKVDARRAAAAAGHLMRAACKPAYPPDPRRPPAAPRQGGFSMAKAWDARCRRWYGDRYDFRRNMVRRRRGAPTPPPLDAAGGLSARPHAPRQPLRATRGRDLGLIPAPMPSRPVSGPPASLPRRQVDWDYNMRLAPRGNPRRDPGLGSIIHSSHFRWGCPWACVGRRAPALGPADRAGLSARAASAWWRVYSVPPLANGPPTSPPRHWRETGVAHELRGGAYDAPNTTLLTAARGRTKEFKDRCGAAAGQCGAWAGGGAVRGPPGGGRPATESAARSQLASCTSLGHPAPALRCP
jgi:hypothetical protein